MSSSPNPNETPDPYVETRGGLLFVRGSEVRLERLILAWSRGERPDVLRDRFPSLGLAAIYGAIAHYLSHKDEIDRLIAEYRREHPDEDAPRHSIGSQSHQVESREGPHDAGMRFDHFTERARKTLTLAQEEAQRLNHNYIGTEHLLLGLVREGDGVAAQALSRMGVELDAVREAVGRMVGRGDRVVLGDIGLTPRAKKVVELAVDESRRMGRHYVGTEHLLLGMVREGEGIAAQVLEALGVNLERLRIATIEVITGHPNPATGARTRAEEPTAAAAGEAAAAATPRGMATDAFVKFTQHALKTLSLANEEAQRFNHHYIGTEHLLLGLVSDSESTAAKVLRHMHVEVNKVRSAVEFIIGRGDRIVLGETGLTPRSKKVIELAVDEARRRNAHYIGTEHLLLGLIRECEGVAAGVLESLGVMYDSAEAATTAVLREQETDEE